MIVANGSADVSTYFVLRDATTHAPKTDVTITDIDLYYTEQGAAMADKVDATALAAADSAHADNKAFHVGQGIYRIDWPDAAFDGGVGKTVILSVVCSGVDTTFLEVELSPAVSMPSLSATVAAQLGIVATGTAQSGGNTSIVVAAGTAFASDIVNGSVVVITGGTGAGQTRLITDWDNGSVTATVDPAWVTNPASNSTYVILAAPPASTVAPPAVTIGAGGIAAASFVNGSINAAAINADAITAIQDGLATATAVADVPTVAEFEARTLAAADYVVVDDTIAAVTAVGSVTGAAAKKNTALAKFSFVMRDSTNHAPVTGKTVTCTRSIDGGAFAAGTLANVAELSAGVYLVDFGAGDLNGTVVTLRATAADCDDMFVTLLTTP